MKHFITVKGGSILIQCAAEVWETQDSQLVSVSSSLLVDPALNKNGDRESIMPGQFAVLKLLLFFFFFFFN